MKFSHISHFAYRAVFIETLLSIIRTEEMNEVEQQIQASILTINRICTNDKCKTTYTNMNQSKLIGPPQFMRHSPYTLLLQPVLLHQLTCFLENFNVCLWASLGMPGHAHLKKPYMLIILKLSWKSNHMQKKAKPQINPEDINNLLFQDILGISRQVQLRTPEMSS